MNCSNGTDLPMPDLKMTLDGLLGALKANLEAATLDPDWAQRRVNELVLQGEPGDDAMKKLLDRGVLRIRIQTGDPYGLVALDPVEWAPEAAVPPG